MYSLPGVYLQSAKISAFFYRDNINPNSALFLKKTGTDSPLPCDYQVKYLL